MPNQITANGIETATESEIRTKLENGFRSIYGADINLDSDSPDGQVIALITQMVLDQGDLIAEVFNSMNPDNALGRVLDQRGAFNGVVRKGGSYTIQPIAIDTDRLVTLKGIDLYSVDESYKVEDNEGNQYVLIDTTTLPSNSIAESRDFRAVEIGNVSSALGTITKPVDIVLGVGLVNNLISATTQGSDEESDYQFKLRRKRAVSRASSGYLASLYAELEAIEEIDSVQIYENKTSEVNNLSMEPHSIWVIVSGLAQDADIGTAIYKKRNGGVSMKGDQSYQVTQVDGTPFIVNWDEATLEVVYLEFTVQKIDTSLNTDYETLRTKLVEQFKPDIGENANINDVSEIVRDIDSNLIVTSGGFAPTSSDPLTPIIYPTTKDKQIVLSGLEVIILGP